MPFLRKGKGIATSGVALPLLGVIALVAALRDRCAEWWFRVRHSGTTFVICSRRDGWHEFLVNNLVPIVPERTTVMWFESASRNVAARSFPRSCQRALAKAGRPTLLTVVHGGIRVVPLHDELTPWKGYVARDAQVQARVCEILRAARDRAVSS